MDGLSFGRDCAETGRRWRNDFLSRKDGAMALGSGERFMRTWTFYLACCEAGFDTGDIDVVPFTWAK